MNKHVTEQELVDSAKGERITLEALNQNIVDEFYFTAAQGIFGQGVDSGAYHPIPAGSTDMPEACKLLTICVLVLRNGFTVTGHSACADPKNFNEEIGRRLARTDAANKIWAFMGYELKSRMARDQRLVGGSPVEAAEGFTTYIGTKVVHAIPMDRIGYNELRGWEMPTDENNDEGYLVEYADRVERNPAVPGMQGYASWSPKEVFERAYRPVRAAEAQPAAASAEGTGEASTTIDASKIIASGHTSLLPDWKTETKQVYVQEYDAIFSVPVKEETWLDRAKAELAELTARYEKLEVFLRTDAFSRLPNADRKDIYVQVNHMEGYKHALAKRVARANSIAAAADGRVLQQQAQQFQNRDAG
ncbi:Gp49 family protein [Mesorhizobium sp. M0618]|uniref:Gp49 family protein n=1 Tax=Mesorhizobium sp. M0618 TaxID=2956972 RepID=UPI003339C927